MQQLFNNRAPLPGQSSSFDVIIQLKIFLHFNISQDCQHSYSYTYIQIYITVEMGNEKHTEQIWILDNYAIMWRIKEAIKFRSLAHKNRHDDRWDIWEGEIINWSQLMAIAFSIVRRTLSWIQPIKGIAKGTWNEWTIEEICSFQCSLMLLVSTPFEHVLCWY